MDNIYTLISAIKAEAEAQKNELEQLTNDIFAILNECKKATETDKSTFEYVVTFDVACCRTSGRKIWFSTFCKKQICKEAFLQDFSKSVTLEETQTAINNMHNKEAETYTERTKQAIEQIYNAGEILPFMQYLSEKIIPQFLRGNITFSDYHF